MIVKYHIYFYEILCVCLFSNVSVVYWGGLFTLLFLELNDLYYLFVRDKRNYYMHFVEIFYINKVIFGLLDILIILDNIENNNIQLYSMLVILNNIVYSFFCVFEIRPFLINMYDNWEEEIYNHLGI